jgi:hypothetical protein
MQVPAEYADTEYAEIVSVIKGERASLFTSPSFFITRGLYPTYLREQYPFAKNHGVLHFLLERNFFILMSCQTRRNG